jgi:hypothetical protein
MLSVLEGARGITPGTGIVIECYASIGRREWLTEVREVFHSENHGTIHSDATEAGEKIYSVSTPGRLAGL